jgi:hypothetical protein
VLSEMDNRRKATGDQVSSGEESGMGGGFEHMDALPSPTLIHVNGYHCGLRYGC